MAHGVCLVALGFWVLPPVDGSPGGSQSSQDGKPGPRGQGSVGCLLWDACALYTASSPAFSAVILDTFCLFNWCKQMLAVQS